MTSKGFGEMQTFEREQITAVVDGGTKRRVECAKTQEIGPPSAPADLISILVSMKFFYSALIKA